MTGKVELQMQGKGLLLDNRTAGRTERSACQVTGAAKQTWT